ncbi:MAG: DoxX family protein [Actinomycetota bacterium]
MDEVNLGLLILRVAIGLTMAAHGYAKTTGPTGLAGTAGWFDSMGMRPGKVHARLASSTEIVAGLLLAAGLLTPFAGAAFVGLMIVAGWTVHRDNGFFIVKDGWEYNFVLGLVAVAIATTGPGEWSVDEALGIATDLDGVVGLAISLGLGVLGGVAQVALFYRPPAPAESG